MIVEIITILSIFIGGVALMRVAGIKGWVLPALGFITGIAILVIIGTIQAVTAVPTTPVLTISIIIFFPVAWWFKCYSQGQDVSFNIIPALLTIGFIVLAVTLFRVINLQCLTVDSFRYIEVGSLLESGNLEHATPNLLLTRLLAVPMMHAAANLADEFYFRSITPLLSLSTVVILAWFIYEGLHTSNIETRLVKLSSIIGACLLVTNNRFIFNAFYINGHMLTTVLLLLLIGCGWLLIKNSRVSLNALLMLQVISIPVLIVTRPENSLFAGIALLPFLTSGKVSWKYRILLIAAIGFSLITWYGFLWIKYSGYGEAVPLSVVGMFSLGIGLILIAPLLAWRKINQILPYCLPLTELGLWMVLIVFTFYDSAPLKRSILATIDNIFLGYGGWGSSLVLLIIISASVMVLTKVSDRIYLRFPLTTFFPFVFLLVYLREGAYRVGHGDSLNRMFLHILPLAILFIISTMTSEEFKLPERLRNTWQRLITSVKNKEFEY